MPAGNGLAGAGAADSRAAADGPTSEEPDGNHLTGDDPAADDSPAADGPAAGNPASEEPGGDRPTGNGPAAGNPANKGPSGNRLKGDKATAGAPADDGPANDGPANDGPAADGSGTSGPATDDGPATGGPALLELVHATKAFGAVRALLDGSITLYPGQVHALVGENGAGKSTLVKILAGVHQPDSGSLLVDGHRVTLHGPTAAKAAGIAVIYQEPTLFPDLSVAENMFIGRQPLRAGRRIDTKKMRAEAQAIFSQLGVPLEPARIARGLSIADQQVVEIGKALSLDARVIVMDEPTAALSAAEVNRLFDVIRTLRQNGAAVLFISHRLEEVFAICQRVTVMRDGRQVLTSELDGLTADDLVRAMVGRQMPERTVGERGRPGEPALAVERLTREGVFTDISFVVRSGEIVALAGLVGAGRSEVARAIFGIDRYDAGHITVGGRALRKAAPTVAMAAGIGLVPEDRHQQGLVMDMSVQQNMALASLSQLRHGGIIRSATERAFASDWAVRLRLRYGRLTDPVSSLSGGNQQKVVLAKWLGRKPSVLIVDEPTRGIDIAAKAEVHRLLTELATSGVAILMISSELPEVLHIGDRILVMREGRLVAELAHAEASEEKIMAAATGQIEAGTP